MFLRAGNPMHSSCENTVVGRAILDGSALRLGTNSRERAAAGRPAPAAAPLPTDDAEEMNRAFKERHYADWADKPLPALGGNTPRRAIRTAEGRAAVDVLLKDMENREQRTSPGVAFDFGSIRRELRLD